MTKFILLSIALFALASCNRYQYQVFDTKSTSNLRIENNSYVFENDSVKIIYNFWGNKGRDWFQVYNKLNVPIFLDAEKSALLRNDECLTRWKDETITSTASLSTKLNYWNGTTATNVGSTASTHEKKMVFIAPHSFITREDYILLLIALDLNNKNTVNYNFDSSPARLTNYLTFSIDIIGKNEFIIGNSFYANHVIQVSEKMFNGKQLSHINNQYTYQYPYTDPTKFYFKIQEPH